MKSVGLEFDGSVAIITIDNPPLNLTDADVFNGLEDAFDQIETSNARAVLLRAAGDHFGCGVNIKTTFVGTDAVQARSLIGRSLSIMQRMEALPIPIVCAVQGFCFAAALEIALRCDIIVASETAQFAQVEAAIGAATFLGGAYLLAERCGPVRAREICYTGQFFSAAKFEQWNIINQVVPDDELETASMAFSQQIADGPTKAHGVTKKLLRQYLDHGVRAADDLLLGIGTPLFDSEDFRHGVETIVTHGSKAFRDRTRFVGR